MPTRILYLEIAVELAVEMKVVPDLVNNELVMLSTD